MDYRKFLRIVKGRESYNIDFKLKCEAFLGKGLASKGELAKDICAMANNGNIASHIIVGVSDDCRSFVSVSNKNLTDDNLQSFCKEAVFPPPSVRLDHLLWKKGPRGIVDKAFVAITIGPNPRQAFRLARDFIENESKTCLRRNEVWIRRGATTDLATPEEVARLVNGKPFIDRQKSENNQQYLRLSRNQREDVMATDLKACLREIGGALVDNRAVIPIQDETFVFRYMPIDNLVGRGGVYSSIYHHWHYEHGLLIISLGTVSKVAMPSFATVSFKERWGWFSDQPMIPIEKRRVFADTLGGDSGYVVPDNSGEMSLIAVALPQIHDTDSLRTSIFAFKQFIEQNEDSLKRMRESRRKINTNLNRWLKEGWLRDVNPYNYVGRKKKFEPYKIKELISDARTVLKLSRFG